MSITFKGTIAFPVNLTVSEADQRRAEQLSNAIMDLEPPEETLIAMRVIPLQPNPWDRNTIKHVYVLQSSNTAHDLFVRNRAVQIGIQPDSIAWSPESYLDTSDEPVRMFINEAAQNAFCEWITQSDILQGPVNRIHKILEKFTPPTA